MIYSRKLHLKVTNVSSVLIFIITSLSACDFDKQGVRNCDFIAVLESKCKFIKQENNEEWCKLSIANTFSFGWDSFTMLPGPMMHEEIAEHLKARFNSSPIQDGYRRIFFLRDNNVICEYDYPQLSRTISTLSISNDNSMKVANNKKDLKILRERNEAMCKNCYFYTIFIE